MQYKGIEYDITREEDRVFVSWEDDEGNQKRWTTKCPIGNPDSMPFGKKVRTAIVKASK